MRTDREGNQVREPMQGLKSNETPSQPQSTGAVSAWIDTLVEWLKWPSACLALAITPLLIWALAKTLLQTVSNPTSSLIPFVAGVLVFLLLWRRWLSRSRWGSFMITLEHESTHALFAFLTGHSIVGFRASMGQGGEVRFAGRGNWLITAAPYFFPTAAIFLFLIAYFLPFSALPWQTFMLGVALSYHLVSTYRETHRDQTDIRLLGRLFCWMFLPAANLAVIGILIAFSHTGNAGLQQWLDWIQEPVVLFVLE